MEGVRIRRQFMVRSVQREVGFRSGGILRPKWFQIMEGRIRSAGSVRSSWIVSCSFDNSYEASYFLAELMRLVAIRRGLKIIREGDDYYLIHGGEVQRHLGRKRDGCSSNTNTAKTAEEEKGPCLGMLDKILFFIGDLESATMKAKPNQLM